MLFVDYKLRLADCPYKPSELHKLIIQNSKDLEECGRLFYVGRGQFQNELIVTTRSSIILRSIRNSLVTLQPGLMDGFV
jgi:hypothetical protein